MKVADLKKELKSRGLAVTGNKTELVERLQLAVMPSETTEEDDSALLEEADNILGEEEAAAPAVAPAPEKKKVAINRDSALPAMTPTDTAPPAGADTDKPEEKKEEEPKKTEEEPLPATTPTGKKRSE